MRMSANQLAAFGPLSGKLATNPEWARITRGNVALFKAFVGDDFMPKRPVDAIAEGACAGLPSSQARLVPMESLHRTQRFHRQGG